MAEKYEYFDIPQEKQKPAEDGYEYFDISQGQPPSPPSFAGQAQGQSTPASKPTDLGRYAKDLALGIPETASGLATGMLGATAGMGAELLAPFAGKNAEQAKQLRSDVQNYLTYQPVSQSGKGAVELAGKVGGALMKPSEMFRSKVEQAYGPEWGRAAGLPAEVANMVLLGKAPGYAKAGAKAVGRAIPAEMPRNIAAKVLKPSLAKDWTRQAKGLDIGESTTGMSPGEMAYENTKRNRAVDTIVNLGLKPTKEGMIKINELRHNTGQAIGSLLTDAPKVDMNPVYDNMRQAGYKRAKNAVERAHVDALVEEEKAKYGDSIDAKTAHELKQEAQYGQRTTYGKYTPHIEDAVEKAKGHTLNTHLRKNMGYQELNRQYNDYNNAQTVLERAAPRLEQNTNEVARAVKLLRGGGPAAAIGTAVGGPVGGAIGGALGYALDEAITSPGGRMARANAIAKLRNWANQPESLRGPLKGYVGPQGPVEPPPTPNTPLQLPPPPTGFETQGSPYGPASIQGTELPGYGMRTGIPAPPERLGLPEPAYHPALPPAPTGFIMMSNNTFARTPWYEAGQTHPVLGNRPVPLAIEAPPTGFTRGELKTQPISNPEVAQFINNLPIGQDIPSALKGKPYVESQQALADQAITQKELSLSDTQARKAVKSAASESGSNENILRTIKSEGGIDMENAAQHGLKGDLQDLTNKESGLKGVVKQTGGKVNLDRALEIAIEKGMLPQSATMADLMDLLKEHARKQRRSIGKGK